MTKIVQGTVLTVEDIENDPEEIKKIENFQ